MDGTDGTVVRERSTGRSNRTVLGSTRKKHEVRTTKRGNSTTQRQIADTEYDNTKVKWVIFQHP
jgi:hypothetical protein